MESDSADYARRTERIKNLLSSYYGSAGDSQPGTPGSNLPPAKDAAAAVSFGGAQQGGTAAPHPSFTTLDSPAFNPERHITQMLKTYTLDKMLTEHKAMSREIKNLDSDMQQLVYENYNKFISATDTIRSMKSAVDAIEGDMSKLRVTMDGVADKSDAVNAKLQRQRQHTDELGQVQALLVKLQAVFDLPRRMRAALEDDALASAVAFYAEAQPLLKKYRHRSAVRAVAADAEAVAKDAAALLRRRLAEKRGGAETEAVVLLLRQLGEGDAALQERYLAGRAERMNRVLAAAHAVAGAMAAAGAGTVGAVGVPGVEDPAAWGFSAEGAPPRLGAFLTRLDEMLINCMQETAANVDGIFLQGDRSAARRKPLVAMARQVVADYWRVVRRAVGDAGEAAAVRAARLADAAADAAALAAGSADAGGALLRPDCVSLQLLPDWGADTIAQALSSVSTDIGLLHSALPELGLRDRAAEAAEAAVRGHVGSAFAALEARVVAALQLVNAALAGAGQPGGDADQAAVQLLPAAFVYLSTAVQRGVLALLGGMRAYEGHGRLLGPWHDQLVDAVQAQLQGLFGSLVAGFLAVAKIKASSTQGDVAASADARSSAGVLAAAVPAVAGAASSGDGPKPGLLLLLAKLCTFMEGTVVPDVMEALAAAFPGRGGGRGGDEPPPFVAGEVARRLGTAADSLLCGYVEAHGRGLTLLVRRSVAATNWLAAAEPRAPRPVTDLLLSRLGRAEAEVAKLVENTGRAPVTERLPSKGGHQRGGSISSHEWDAQRALGSVAVERGVAQLFNGKVRIFGPVRFNQAAILSAIAAIGLKSLVECVRLQTLGRPGLQQLQVDAAHLRPRLLRATGAGGYAGDAVRQLLDEVVAAAAERCVEPLLLEPATLERILSAASDQG